MSQPTPATMASTLQRLLDAQRHLDLVEEPGIDYSADAHEAAITELSLAQFAAESVLGEFYAATSTVDGMAVAEGKLVDAMVSPTPSSCGGFAVFA